MSGLPPPSIVTPRLVLRPLRATDAGRVAALAGDPAVARQLERVPSPLPEDVAARWIERRVRWWSERKGVTLAITRAGEMIGAVTLKGDELGYWLGRDHWGQGLATEAARAFLDWALPAFALDRVVARVRPDNPASHRVLAKLGFTGRGAERQLLRPAATTGSRRVDRHDVVFRNPDPRRRRPRERLLVRGQPRGRRR